MKFTQELNEELNLRKLEKFRCNLKSLFRE